MAIGAGALVLVAGGATIVFRDKLFGQNGVNLNQQQEEVSRFEAALQTVLDLDGMNLEQTELEASDADQSSQIVSAVLDIFQKPEPETVGCIQNILNPKIKEPNTDVQVLTNIAPAPAKKLKKKPIQFGFKRKNGVIYKIGNFKDFTKKYMLAFSNSNIESPKPKDVFKRKGENYFLPLVCFEEGKRKQFDKEFATILDMRNFINGPMKRNDYEFKDCMIICSKMFDTSKNLLIIL